jgi:hypothetical protein
MGLNQDSRPKGERGQATIEFILSAVFLLSFLLFGFRLALVFGWSSYIQYATFMSARALLAAGDTQEDQIRRATETMKGMVKRGGRDRFEAFGMGQNGGAGGVVGMEIHDTRNPNGTEDSTWQIGVRYSFRSRLILVPGSSRGGRLGAGAAQGRLLELKSESWLGRDPSSAECESYRRQNRGGGPGAQPFVLDNGC